MNLTVDQARTLDAVARLGSASAAAGELGRVGSAILYQMRQLEDAAGVPVFDRAGYRTGLTAFGRGLLERCRVVLGAVDGVARYCETTRLGFEPTLTIVFDGLLPITPMLAAVRAVAETSPKTRVSLYSEYLGDVETRVVKVDAELAIGIVPFERPLGSIVALTPLTSLLVVAAGHPLARPDEEAGAAGIPEGLKRHTLLTVRGSDPRLGMLPADFRAAAELRLPDFEAKRKALLAGMGWGWMPEHLVRAAIAAGDLVHLRSDPASRDELLCGRHIFTPTLHRRAGVEAGIAARAFVDVLLADPTAMRR